MSKFNFEQFNKRSTIREDVNIKDMEFRPLKDFCGKTINVDGFFFTTGNYGKQVVVVGNGYKINMPARAVEEFQNMAINDDALDEILAGHLCLTNIKMIDTKNGSTVAYKFTNK